MVKSSVPKRSGICLEDVSVHTKSVSKLESELQMCTNLLVHSLVCEKCSAPPHSVPLTNSYDRTVMNQTVQYEYCGISESTTH